MSRSLEHISDPTDPTWSDQRTQSDILDFIPNVRFCYKYKISLNGRALKEGVVSRRNEIPPLGKGQDLKVTHYDDESKIDQPYRDGSRALLQKIHTCNPHKAINGDNQGVLYYYIKRV